VNCSLILYSVYDVAVFLEVFSYTLNNTIIQSAATTAINITAVDLAGMFYVVNVGFVHMR